MVWTLKCCRTWREERDLCGLAPEEKGYRGSRFGASFEKSMVQVHVLKFAEVPGCRMV